MCVCVCVCYGTKTEYVSGLLILSVVISDFISSMTRRSMLFKQCCREKKIY